MTEQQKNIFTYQKSGVNIDAGNELARRIARLAKPTHRPEIISGVGGFAGLSAIPTHFHEPLIVASTDGVGTKLKIAQTTGNHRSIGIDLVAMGVNDIITVGAEPLFFLDYFATGKLFPDQAETIIKGIVDGCQQANCTLLGGETAEMPDMYGEGEYDLAGFAVGIVERSRLINGSKTAAGDLVIGIPSSGLHSNGFSLARKILDPHFPNLSEVVPSLGVSLGDELLKPTIIYVDHIKKLAATVEMHALAHITGGGLIDNPPRVIPENLSFRFSLGSWKVPPIMDLIATLGNVPEEEMRRTFNMGLGMIVVIPRDQAKQALDSLSGSGAMIAGEIIPRNNQSVEFIS